MNRVKAGYLGSMATLFERYQSPLYNFFRCLTSDAEQSQDLTQSVFLRALKYRNTFNDRYMFRAWIYRLSRNLYYDDYSKSKRRSEYSLKEREEKEIRLSCDTDANRERTKRELDDALRQLRSQDRELIIMSKYQGLKYEEISKIIKVSVPAIKTKMRRAMNKLREIYFEEEPAK